MSIKMVCEEYGVKKQTVSEEEEEVNMKKVKNRPMDVVQKWRSQFLY